MWRCSGTNGAGKSTLLRAVSGLSHPHRGVVRLFGMNSTYLEPEQIIDEGVPSWWAAK